MTSRDFCFWLQGYFEIATTNKSMVYPLTEKQVNIIQNHLALVFKHEIDPSIGGDQQELQNIHDGVPNNWLIGEQPSIPHDYVLRC